MISAAEIYEFKGAPLRKACTFLFFFFIFLGNVFGQNAANITTTATNPTQNQTIPLNIKFDQPVNLFELSDIQVTNGGLSNFNISTPSYNWLTSFDVDSFHVGVQDAGNPEAKTNRVVISVATNSQGEIFVLTFGNGIYRINQDGTKTQLTDGSNLESPLDFAINKEDKFFVADNGQARQIKVFSPTGVYLPGENIGNGNAGSSENNFYGPVGLTFDEDDNLYVADSYSGSDTSEFDRYSIKIYYSNGDYARLIRDSDAGKEIFNPYRVAVDKDGNIYVSDSGGTNGRVIIFSSDLKYLDTLEGPSDNLGSPGSIVIDDYGYIYIADLGDEVSITQLLNAEDNPEELLDVFPLIRDGIKNDEFDINVYDSNRNYLRSISNKIDLPVDLGLDSCGRFLVNNAIFDGTIGNLFGFPIPDIDLDFDIEVYNRLPETFTVNLTITEECIPSKVKVPEGVANNMNCDLNSSSNELNIIWDKTNPVISSCIYEQNEVLSPSGNFEIPDYKDSEEFQFSDNCDTTGELQITQTPVSGTTISTDTEVELKVMDGAGNFSKCTFWIRLSEEEPPSAECNSFEVILDEDGNAQIAAEQVYAGNKDLELKINKDSFNCSHIGSNLVQLTVTDPNTELTDTCTATITVLDSTAPEIVGCLQDREIILQEGESYSIPDFRDEIDVIDNCTVQREQIPAPGTNITETTEITFRVIDDDNNFDECSFRVEIKQAQEPIIQCQNSYIVYADDTCTYSAPDFSQIIEYTPTDAEYAQSISPNSILDSANDQHITFSVTNDGITKECNIEIIYKDAQTPNMECFPSQTIELSEGETYIIPNYVEQVNATDNCVLRDVFQVPAAGSEVSEDTDVIITAIDDAGNESYCEFLLTINYAENLNLNCPGDYPVFADENCQYFVPDFSEIVEVSPEGATIEQSIDAGTTTITNADPFVTITATYEGQTETCKIYLLLKDEVAPTINCIADQTVTIAEGETYTLPDYRDQLDISDNCDDYQVVQDPAPHTEVTEDTEVSFTVTDQAGITDSCSFDLNVITEGSLAISCPADKTENLNEYCSFTVPDYTTEAQVSNAGDAEISQTPEAGTVVTGSGFEVALRVEKDDEFDECTFFVSLEDNIAPVARCVTEYKILLGDGDTVVFDPHEIDRGSSDNCGDIDLSLSQTEFTSADEGVNTVTLTVTDASGNSSSCEAVIQVIVVTGSVNDPPVAIDEEYTTEINTTLNVSASNGVLVNDTDPENDALTAILDSDVSHGNLELNADGSFVYTPDTGFVGQDYFTYFANDGEFNSNVIFVSLNVVDSSGDFGCNSQVVLSLGPEGEARLDMALLYYGNAEGIEVSADQLVFTCDDIGENLVTLTYTGRLEGSCEVPVRVVDDAPPVLLLRDISIDLDLAGNANISFADIDNGSFDQCSDNVEYSLSKTAFSCKNVGENIVQVTAEDEYGNAAVASVTVRVFAEAGICSEVLPGSEYIFIYPNPNTGSFKIATPADVTIQRVEVFDNRGRFITARDYDASVTEYAMETGPLQEGIYVLKLQTNEGVYIKRMIFKN